MTWYMIPWIEHCYEPDMSTLRCFMQIKSGDSFLHNSHPPPVSTELARSKTAHLLDWHVSLLHRHGLAHAICRRCCNCNRTLSHISSLCCSLWAAKLTTPHLRPASNVEHKHSSTYRSTCHVNTYLKVRLFVGVRLTGGYPSDSLSCLSAQH